MGTTTTQTVGGTDGIYSFTMQTCNSSERLLIEVVNPPPGSSESPPFAPTGNPPGTNPTIDSNCTNLLSDCRTIPAGTTDNTIDCGFTGVPPPPPPPTNTPTLAATPCLNGGLCGLIFSPGYWLNWRNHYTPAQFHALLQSTADYSTLTNAQAEAVLGNTGDQYHRFLLSAELNVANNPQLGTGIYTFGSLSGQTVNQILNTAFNTPAASASADLVDAVFYLGSNGEGAGQSCRVVTTVCGLPPAPTSTPTNTPTRISPSAPTPTPTATPCTTDGLCRLIFSPGYWKNWQNHYTSAQFLTLIHGTADYNTLTIAQAQAILGNTSDQYHRFLLSAELNVAQNPQLGTGIYTFGSLSGQTVNQILTTAFNTPVASASAVLIDAVFYVGSNGEGAGQNCRVVTTVCGSAPSRPNAPAAVSTLSCPICPMAPNELFPLGGRRQGRFNGTAIPAGNFIWFNSTLKPPRGLTAGTTIFFENQTIQFTANNVNYELSVPDGVVTFDNVSMATTLFDSLNNRWVTTVPIDLSKKVFLAGLALPVPADGLPGGINPVRWSGRFFTNAPTVAVVGWRWAAAVYTSLGTDYNSLGVKSVDGTAANLYTKSHHAGTAENFSSFVTGGARSRGGANFTGSYTSTTTCTLCLR